MACDTRMTCMARAAADSLSEVVPAAGVFLAYFEVLVTSHTHAGSGVLPPPRRLQAGAQRSACSVQRAVRHRASRQAGSVQRACCGASQHGCTVWYTAHVGTVPYGTHVLIA